MAVPTKPARRETHAGFWEPSSLRALTFLMSSPHARAPRLGGEERRLMHLVPAPAVRLMKSRVLSRPGVNSLVHKLVSVSLVLISFDRFSGLFWALTYRTNPLGAGKKHIIS